MTTKLSPETAAAVRKLRDAKALKPITVAVKMAKAIAAANAPHRQRNVETSSHDASD